MILLALDTGGLLNLKPRTEFYAVAAPGEGLTDETGEPITDETGEPLFSGITSWFVPLTFWLSTAAAMAMLLSCAQPAF